MRRGYGLAAAISLLVAGLILAPPRPQGTCLRFEVTTSGLPAASGRLFIIIAGSSRPEPRETIGETGMDAPPILARDVKDFGPGITATIDRNSAIFPVPSLESLPAGDYDVQALFDTNSDLSSVNAPGNRYSDI